MTSKRARRFGSVTQITRLFFGANTATVVNASPNWKPLMTAGDPGGCGRTLASTLSDQSRTQWTAPVRHPTPSEVVRVGERTVAPLGVPWVGNLTGQGLEQDAPERVAVGTRIDSRTFPLLGRHVVSRAHRNLRLSHLGAGGHALGEPKSARYACSPRRRLSTSTFAGLTSRCTRPCSWALSSASAIWSTIFAARAGSSLPCEEIKRPEIGAME